MTRDLPPLVGRDWLQQHLDDPRVLPVEVGEDASSYHVAHLPGAVSLDWLEELQEPVQRGFVRQARFEALMDVKGVERDTHLVLYGSDDPVYAASAFWVLRYYQHPRLSLLDGGKPHWLAGGHQVSGEPVENAPGSGYRSPGPDESVRIDRDLLLQAFVGAPRGRAVIDCRTPGSTTGCRRTRWTCLSNATGCRATSGRPQLPERPAPHRGRHPAAGRGAARGVRPARGRPRRQHRGRGLLPGAERSALHWFVLSELLGHPWVRNYDGGWAEYGSLVHAPVAR